MTRRRGIDQLSAPTFGVLQVFVIVGAADAVGAAVVGEKDGAAEVLGAAVPFSWMMIVALIVLELAPLKSFPVAETVN